MVDIHSHILPGLDDGAKDLETSVAMLRLAVESGTTDIVATPHANLEFAFDPDLIDRKIAEVQAAAGPIPRIHAGCDFHLTMENIDDALAHPGKYAINHKCYVLVEFSELLIPRTTPEIFERFQGAGLTPIVTHPERNSLLHKRLDQVQAWIEKGTLVQVTGKSLLGAFGRSAKSVASEMMNRGMVHFIASDAHDTARRPPILREAYQYVEKMWGVARAKMLFVTAPQAVIAGVPIVLDDIDPVRPKRNWYRFGF